MTETTITVPQDSETKGPEAYLVPHKPVLTQRELTLLIVFALIAATLLLYRPTLHHFFQTYDDPPYVVENVHVNKGLSWQNIRWAFSATYAANWHPITWISHMADVQAFGIKPMGHHLDSILWHTLNVVLLFLLLRAASGYLWRSATVAALFALCPLNVECAAWIAERKSLISTTFLFLTLFAYGWYVRRRRVARYAAVISLFALALMAKPMVVTLPVLLLLLDYWPLRRFSLPRRLDWASLKAMAWLVLEKAPLLVLSAVSSAITIYAQKEGGALGWSVLIPLRFRIPNAIYSYVLYIVKMFWPSRLAPFYPHPEGSLKLVVVVGAGLVLAAITFAVWRYRESRVFAVSWAWYLVTMFPVIGIIQVGPQGRADRYAYLPFIGLFVAVVWLAADVIPLLSTTKILRRSAAQDLRSKNARTLDFRRKSQWIAAVGVLAGYAWVSHVQIGYWIDSYALFSHALAVNPRNGMAEGELGFAHLGAGKFDLAEREFRTAAEYMPDVPTFDYNLGIALEHEGRIKEALAAYRESAFRGEGTQAYNAIATILMRHEDVSDAIAEYDSAVGARPDAAESLFWRGVIDYRKGRFDAAVADLTNAAQSSPTPSICYALGRALESKGDIAAAQSAYQRALALEPRYSDAASRLKALTRK